MQLTYNKFKQVVDLSNQKLFDKVAEALAVSDNAALVAMYDDKLMVLDEQNEQLYLCNYTLENGKLGMHNFEPVSLIENDSSYLEEVVDKYFDLDDESPITLGEMLTGFNLKFKNESKHVFTEAEDLKARKEMESPRIRAIKKAREARDMFAEEIQNLLEEPFIQHLTMKTDQAQDAIAPALNKVSFKQPYPIFVNLWDPNPEPGLITLRDNTNVMDAMKNVAKHLSDKWKSDAFRGKFEKMVNQIIRTESVELARTLVLNFLDENKELFLLKDSLFEELMVKTSLMLGETDTDSVLKIFKNIMESKEGRMMKIGFFRKNKIDESKLAEVNAIVEQGEAAPAADAAATPAEPSKKAGNDLDTDEVNKIIDIFKKIKKNLEEDSPEASYIDGLISALDSAKVSGIEDSKMKEVIDFLSSVGNSKKGDKGEAEATPDKDKEVEL
jgi:hypothetical protein